MGAARGGQSHHPPPTGELGPAEGDHPEPEGQDQGADVQTGPVRGLRPGHGSPRPGALASPDAPHAALPREQSPRGPRGALPVHGPGGPSQDGSPRGEARQRNDTLVIVIARSAGEDAARTEGTSGESAGESRRQPITHNQSHTTSHRGKYTHDQSNQGINVSDLKVTKLPFLSSLCRGSSTPPLHIVEDRGI